MKQMDVGTTVYYTLDLDAPPNRLSAAQRAILRRRPIDFSDIPPQAIDETWYRPAWALAVAARNAQKAAAKGA